MADPEWLAHPDREKLDEKVRADPRMLAALSSRDPAKRSVGVHHDPVIDTLGDAGAKVDPDCHPASNELDDGVPRHHGPARTPKLVAPVSRFLGVADAARSLTFYREVLGFDVRTLREENESPCVFEAVYGPARIECRTADSAVDSTGERRPRGAAIVFFQTDDVAAIRAAIRARGGQPSELEKVNWIKMRMFEVRDPDGHTLWFGQSYDEPDARRPQGLLCKSLPELPLDDVPAGVAYYRDVLGFTVNYAQHDLGVMDRDQVTLLLIARTERHRGIGSCEVYVNDADALYAELLAKGANVQGEPASHPWGLRDFRVLDLEGNQITFAQPFE